VHTNSIYHLHFEPGTLQGVDDKTEWGRSVGARENVLVHEEAPSEVLKLPCFAETSDLEEEDTVIVKHVINLAEERAQVADTDVFGHFETGNFIVAAGRKWYVTVVHAEDVGLVLLDSRLAEAIVAPSSLVAAKSNASHMGTIVDGSKPCEGAPSAANVEHLLALLQANLFTNNGHFVVLELLKTLFLVDVGNDAGGVDHAWTEEPAVEVVTTVVVVAYLLFV